MAWTIVTWSRAEGTGTIASPHFGPIPFDARANVDNVDDFREGEAVWVELDGSPPAFRIALLRPMAQRQPAGTHHPVFDVVNGRSDAELEEQTEHALQLWLGFCCQRCEPYPMRVRFEGITTVSDSFEDAELSNPLFRIASPAEIASRQLVVPEGSTAFCIVTSHGNGRDGPSFFVVAREVAVTNATWSSRVMSDH